jgi:hypothetical protein
MKILVGNDWKSTAAGYAGSVQVLAGTLTAVLGEQAAQDPKHNLLWVSLGAFVLFISSVVRIKLGTSQNYLQTDPNIGTLDNAAVVNVTTTGLTPKPISPVTPAPAQK